MRPDGFGRSSWLWPAPVLLLLLTGVVWHVVQMSIAARTSEPTQAGHDPRRLKARRLAGDVCRTTRRPHASACTCRDRDASRIIHSRRVLVRGAVGLRHRRVIAVLFPEFAGTDTPEDAEWQ
jgi:hypothetical protein